MIRRSLCGVITAACVLLVPLSASAGQDGRTFRFSIGETFTFGSPEPIGRSGALPEFQLPDFQPPPSPAQPGPTLQWISIVLLSGEMEAGPAAADDIPPAVRRAMADVQDFLPFKSYRLVDAALLGPPRRGVPSMARLSRTVRASGGLAMPPQTFQASVMVISAGSGSAPVTRGPLTLSFSLSELASGQEGLNLIGTTVTLDVGETVVVGTSRIGGTALIALLTAVPATR